MNSKKIFGLIGICQKARKLVAGEFAVKQAVLESKAQLVIVTRDASDNTKKLFLDKSSYRGIICLVWGTREELGQVLGKEERVVVGILDIQLAAKLEAMIKEDLKVEKDLLQNDG